MDQLIIGDKASFDDYGASMAQRFIGMPTKKSIKETVPFSNVTYDFSAINGEVFWNERELEYVFEMMASTPEELEEMKMNFSNWVMDIIEEEIHDPFIPEYHFIGTYDDMKYEDEEGLDKTTVTVTFMAHPLKVSNTPRTYRLELEPSVTNEPLSFASESVRNVYPTVVTDRSCTLVFYSEELNIRTSVTLDVGTHILGIGIPKGCYDMYFTNNSHEDVCNIEVSFYEEAF